MNNSRIIERLSNACATEKGLLAIVKMDNLIMFKDVYGKDVIQRFQEECESIIDSSTESSDIKGCLGTDEFVIFYKNMHDKQEMKDVCSYIEKRMHELAAEYASDEKDVSVDISVGAVMVPEQGTNYEDLFDKADKALDNSTDKNNVVFYDFSDVKADSDDGAMWLSAEEYNTVHRFLENYIHTYKNPACELVISFSELDEDLSQMEFDRILESMSGAVKMTLRKSDVMMKRGDKLFLLLPEITQQHTISVVNRLKNRLYSLGLDDTVGMHIDSHMIGPEREYPVWLKAVI
ncbi:diguanylate cyclase (GGDEF) domain-containing protein [Lachnospiraceae bacterium NE2001]|nr:diguanylate cyclase (GGDEF) domain-containing protein [Lachnospiraceae bacterium NE2001]